MSDSNFSPKGGSTVIDDGSAKSLIKAFNLSAIPVIASFSDDGRILPLYVKINGERYKVASSWSEKLFRSQTIFHCRLEVNNMYKTATLTYFTDSGLWAIQVESA